MTTLFMILSDDESTDRFFREILYHIWATKTFCWKNYLFFNHMHALLFSFTFASSLTWLWKSFWSTLEYSVRTFTTVFANLFIYLFQISGSWHSSFWRTSKHWVSCVNTSTTEFEKLACSVFFWNYCEKKNIDASK